MLMTNNNISNESIWIISNGRHIDFDLNRIGEQSNHSPVKEYLISDFARYLLTPHPIQIEEKLMGCEVHFRPSAGNRIKDKLRRILAVFSRKKLASSDDIIIEKYMSTPILPMSRFRDEALDLHISQMGDMLRPYDATLRELSKLDISQIEDVIGMCEDSGKNKYRLNLQGTIEDKLGFIMNSLFREVKITLKRPYLSDGLFEVRGYDFKKFDPKKYYRLIKFYKNGAAVYCILNHLDQVEFRVDDLKTIYYLHLLSQSVDTNPKLKESFDQCIKGSAKPFKLFFNKQVEIDYSKADLPAIYKEVFDLCNLGIRERNMVMASLNHYQRVVLFNYIPQSDAGEEKLYTNISVMHDFRALEPIKDSIPELYSEMNKRSPASEAGKFYLLDSMRGYLNEK